ncbi:FAD:protein FMN transferase [Subtercola sp. RTI3]|uniref:FAD:protein FMN transferase n=1 Tax=Subtercola sp. RTI3 TaxID=3048639 RepID=UPI002B22C139|nr:FAD:protein FMN transferase [Subtercola sp. RTI3]MEA9984988.1 FAD:protein FMN transferase [Subtercola sp. RTI3]
MADTLDTADQLPENITAPDTAAREWSVWSTTARVVVTDALAIDRASELVADVLGEVGRACNRFSPDSELVRLQPRLAEGAEVSDLLALLVRTALGAARFTDGAVDPTLGAVLARLGYDRDIGELRAPRAGVGELSDLRGAAGASPVVTLSTSILGWRRVTLTAVPARPDAVPCEAPPRDRPLRSARRHLLTVPADLTLDLGATAKALAADLAAARVFAELGCGVLVSLGGDIATAGAAPDGGWQITVCDLPGDPSCVITLAAGQALATSSTQKRRWVSNGRALHHILDPAQGLPAAPIWKTVTVAAASCVEANSLSTASIVRGRSAIAWLARRNTAARLVTAETRVLSLGGWPDENSVHVRAAG